MITLQGIDIPVGECLSDESDTYMCVRGRNSCDECAFHRIETGCATICCEPCEREDGRIVHFVKVTNYLEE